MASITRRAAVAAIGASALAQPGLLRAQTSSAPIRIGLLSDVGGPYRDVGGPGSRLAAELAVEDIGGSVLGRPVQILQVDDQNKADVASVQARQWVDEGVTALADGAGSSAALAIQDIARDRKRIFLMTTPTSTVFIGKQCSPYGFQFACNSYALAKGVGGELSRVGGDTWFFITVDYEMGLSLQSNTEPFIKAAGGRVLGTAKAPLGTTDYSAALLEAKSSGAKVIGLAIAGADLQNCIKQAHEFGVVQGGQRLATLMMITDVLALGQDACQGLVLTNSTGRRRRKPRRGRPATWPRWAGRRPSTTPPPTPPFFIGSRPSRRPTQWTPTRLRRRCGNCRSTISTTRVSASRPTAASRTRCTCGRSSLPRPATRSGTSTSASAPSQARKRIRRPRCSAARSPSPEHSPPGRAPRLPGGC